MPRGAGVRSLANFVNLPTGDPSEDRRRSHPVARVGSRLDSTRRRFSMLLGGTPAPIPASPSGSHSQSVFTSAGTRPNGPRENLLATLRRYDTVFLVDDSASMSQHGRWREAGDALRSVAATAVEYDPDGIDIYFLNTNAHLRHARSPHEVDQLFRTVQPTGACTPIEVRVEALTSLHLDALEGSKAQGMGGAIKPMNLVVITDGVTDDPETLIYTIAIVANRLDEGRFPASQLGIQFIQIGNDREASEFLRKLDSDLKRTYGVRRDIVDTTPFKGKLTGEFILKCLLGGINRRIDGDNLR